MMDLVTFRDIAHVQDVAHDVRQEVALADGPDLHHAVAGGIPRARPDEAGSAQAEATRRRWADVQLREEAVFSGH
jgi:hypothetical protein